MADKQYIVTHDMVGAWSKGTILSDAELKRVGQFEADAHDTNIKRLLDVGAIEAYDEKYHASLLLNVYDDSGSGPKPHPEPFPDETPAAAAAAVKAEQERIADEEKRAVEAHEALVEREAHDRKVREDRAVAERKAAARGVYVPEPGAMPVRTPERMPEPRP